ncbi:MAG: hypothetical protein ACRD1H_18235 [Vicinamibacterales bacterium]
MADVRREVIVRRLLLVVVMIAGFVGAVAVARRPRVARTAPAPGFDPVVVGTIEAAGWRAYYERDFLTGFRLLLRLMGDQFGLGPFDALRTAHAAVRAQMAFAPAENDLAAARRWLVRFYRRSPRRDGVAPADLADAELDYWIVHRRIVDERDKTPLIDALARLHALLFGGSEAAMRPSAEQRTFACNAVDRITGQRSTDPAVDWSLARNHLIAAYQLALSAAPSITNA